MDVILIPYPSPQVEKGVNNITQTGDKISNEK
jgi:hypothetical protein